MGKVCANCGCEIPKGEPWYKCLDNYLQVKYFEDPEEKDNVFCSQSCFCESLMLEEIWDEEASDETDII